MLVQKYCTGGQYWLEDSSLVWCYTMTTGK